MNRFEARGENVVIMHVVCCEDFETELEEGYIKFEAVFGKLRTIYVTIVKVLKRL